MTLVHQFIRRSPLIMLVLLFVVSLAGPELSLATDVKIYGSLGGNTFRTECPKGSYLMGLKGRTSAWVNSIAPVCAPWLRSSQALGAPTTGQSFGMSTGMPTPDMFVIVKPFAGDKIPHGQLFITAAPPKAGSTDVAEIELRYLDAPANRQHSYPYTTVFSVTKAQLLDGYPVTAWNG